MNTYLTYQKRFSFQPPKIKKDVNPKLKLIVVIPAYKESSLIPSIQSILKNQYPKKQVEIIVVFNSSKSDLIGQEVNQIAMEELTNYISENKLEDSILFLNEKLPEKHAGVGLARKIGMDEAAYRFSQIENLNGAIICFDADSLCQQNYLAEIDSFFKNNLKVAACSIHFEHPIAGNEFSSVIYEGICFYELHLRYYKQGLSFANLPYAFHSIGSSMAVRAQDYLKQGGMNRRKAGEDFYFLQKFIDIGALGELNSTTVIPSPRTSDRVPFGTGRAIKEMLEQDREIEKSYAFDIFLELKDAFSEIKSWYNQIPVVNQKLIEFYGEEQFLDKIIEIKNNSSSESNFEKRFFQWFNAFKTLKFVHFLRDKYYPNKPLSSSVPLLLQSINREHAGLTIKQLLEMMRSLDKVN